jgi:hypothetical protein
MVKVYCHKGVGYPIRSGEGSVEGRKGQNRTRQGKGKEEEENKEHYAQ